MAAEALLSRRGWLAGALALVFGGVHAQSGTVAGNPANPATGDMIESLKPGRSRSARNLVVRQKPAEDAASAPAPLAAAPSAEPPPATPTTSPTSPTSQPDPGAPAEPAPSLSLAIQFEVNSARVRPESGPVLGNLVAAMQSPELKTSRFLIEGHTDATGSAGTNQRLSQERADEVRLYLVALGVHPSRLRAVGKGSSDLADPLNPQAANNRRVRVVTQP
jgi:outer membrane protein OmpA-like peptidoglycan-associated protein